MCRNPLEIFSLSTSRPDARRQVRESKDRFFPRSGINHTLGVSRNAIEILREKITEQKE